MLKIKSITDSPDGSADLDLEMDYETLVKFAKIGILKVLEDAASEVVSEEPVVPIMTEEFPKMSWSGKRGGLPCISHLPTYMCPGCDCWKSARAYSS